MRQYLQPTLDPDVPVYTSWRAVPAHLQSRKRWKRDRRMIRPKQPPKAIFEWQEVCQTSVEELNTDGTTTWRKEPCTITNRCHLYSYDQTAPYRGSRRGHAVDIYWLYFASQGGRDNYLWHTDKGWYTCSGRLEEWQVKKHLTNDAIYGVWGGKRTRFGAIDLDLHNGDKSIFLEQFQVLLDEFHGKDRWHYQVSDANAGGVHLIQVYPDLIPVSECRARLREKLEALDRTHPELAERARAAGMKTIGQLEIFPDPSHGFRLPLCQGRTMLLHEPLPKVYDKRYKRELPDVIHYVSWLSRPHAYMPAEDVFNYVAARLRDPQPVNATRKSSTNSTKPAKQSGGATEIRSSLGKMKGRYADVITGFWSGELTQPDTLNDGIRLLALMLPYYVDELEAVDLIEQYIDELPDDSFSDRLSSGKRSAVSRVVRNTVQAVYDGNRGQPDPQLSKAKLDLTYQAWQRRGFNPTDKSTWTKTTQSDVAPSLAPDFNWTIDEIPRIAVIQKLLVCDIDVASKALKHLLRLIKAHRGEVAIAYVRVILAGFGIKCGGHHGKVNKLLQLLRDWGWIYVRCEERWHGVDSEGNKLPGRARAYGIGPAIRHKFTDQVGPECSSLASLVAEQAGLRPANYISPAVRSCSLLQPGAHDELCIVSHHSSHFCGNPMPDWLRELVQPSRRTVLTYSGP